MKKTLIVFILILVSWLTADSFDNPVRISLGDAYMLRSTDYNCLGWNPAQLSKFQHKITLGLGTANFYISNNTLSLSYYNSLMGETLDESDKQDLLDRIPADGLGFDINAGGTGPASTLSINNFAFSVSGIVMTSARFPKELFEFIIDDMEFKKYDFSDSRGQLAAVLEYQFGYGHKTLLNEYIPYELPPILAGINIGYIMGMTYAEITEVKSEFVNSSDGITLDNYVKIRTAGIERDIENDEVNTDTGNTFRGNGFRMDIGFVSEISENLTVGLNLKNMFGVIVWNTDCEEHVFSAYGDSLYVYMEDDEFEDVIVDTDTTYSISKITQNIPFEIHLGSKYEWRKFDFYFDLVQGFDSSVFTSSKPKLSLGGEYDILPWLPIRTGFGFGDERSSHYSIGSGFVFNKFEFNWASRTYFSPLASYSKGMTLSFGMMLKF